MEYQEGLSSGKGQCLKSREMDAIFCNIFIYVTMFVNVTWLFARYELIT